MNYKKIYDAIISNRKKNKLKKIKEQYTENHHIIPKSFGGLEGSNVLRVTGREHFILHALLVRIYEKDTLEYNSMVIAFNNMKANPKDCNRYFNSRLFEKYKGEYSRIVSERQSGKGNNQFGTMWITNEILKENKKILKNESIPDGWIKGRCNYKKLEENIINYTELCDKYNIGNLLWLEFKDEYDYKYDYKNFYNNCRKYSKIDLNINKDKIITAERLWEVYKNNTFKKFCELTKYKNTNTTLNCMFNTHLNIDKDERIKLRKINMKV